MCIYTFGFCRWSFYKWCAWPCGIQDYCCWNSTAFHTWSKVHLLIFIHSSNLERFTVLSCHSPSDIVAAAWCLFVTKCDDPLKRGLSLSRKELAQCGVLNPERDLYLGKLVLTKFPKSPETWIHRCSTASWLWCYWIFTRIVWYPLFDCTTSFWFLIGDSYPNWIQVNE